MIQAIINGYAAGEYLAITQIKRTREGEKTRVEFSLDNGLETAVLWYLLDSEFEKYICDDRCDAAVVSLLLSSMKFGYKVLCSDYPISEKLYYNLQYHVIPQIHSVVPNRTSRIKLEMPKTKDYYSGKLRATGMSRGVDSFATVCEYGDSFELEEYQINALTYFKVGAHHGFDAKVGHGEESPDELFENQLKSTIEWCRKYNYPLIVVESNIQDVMKTSGVLKEGRFDATHTLRNLGVVVLLQKGISKYYYSSTYSLADFKVKVTQDMAYYEKWLIPHLSTGSVEMFSSNQDWRRIDKVKKLLEYEPCHDYLQVCLIKTSNCGQCLKCKRTLMELDAYGDDALEKFRNSFDIETYKKEHRKEWFSHIMEYKEQDDSEAHYFEETFLCALEHHPELIGDLIREKAENVENVEITQNKVVFRKYPSRYSPKVGQGKSGEVYKYLGEWAPWVAIESAEGQRAFLRKKSVKLIQK